MDRLLDHIEDQPGNLPVLEYALTELRTFADARLLVTNRIENKDEATGVAASEEFSGQKL